MPPVSTAPAAQLYLDLLKGVLTRYVTREAAPGTEFDPEARADGRDIPGTGETMIGLRRLDNLDECIRTVLADGVPGDLMECGVWRGGASIFMRAALEAHGDAERRVWVADSFTGVPAPDPVAFPEDATSHWLSEQSGLAVSREDVESNFERYGMLDDRVHFVEGPFRDTLPSAEVERLAILRADGDLYESIFVTLESLYDRVSPGGFVIIDDYRSFPPARQATDDFRLDHGIDEPLVPVDWTEVFWRKRA